MIAKLLREPLVHFLALGVGLFLLFAVVGGDDEPDQEQIVVTTGHIESLIDLWSRTWQRAPTSEELTQLIDDYVREEVLYREGLALGLDREDTVIRRRVRQKMEFITEDIATSVEPTEEQLAAYLADHPETYRDPPRVSFVHVYLSRDRRGRAVVEDAERLLETLRKHRGPHDPGAFGDSLPLPYEYEGMTENEVARLFGDNFGAMLMGQPVGRWSGPIESGHGLHLVRVGEITPAVDPDLEQIKAAVRRDWLASRQKEANEALFNRLKQRYTITVEAPPATAAVSTPAVDTR